MLHHSLTEFNIWHLAYLPSYLTCRRLLSQNECCWHCINEITGSGRNTWRFGNTVVSGTIGVGNLSLSALLARLKAFQLSWSADL